MNVEKYKPVADLIGAIADETFPLFCKGPSQWYELLQGLEVECRNHQKRFPFLAEGFIYDTLCLVIGGIFKDEVPFLYDYWVSFMSEDYNGYESEQEGAIVLSFTPDLDPLCRALVDSDLKHQSS